MTVKPGWARKRDRLRRREASAATANAAGSPWALSAAEWRLLVITLVGGVGSIVAAAFIIGGALTIAQSVRNEGLEVWVIDAVEYLVLAPGLLIAFWRFFVAKISSDRARLVARVILDLRCSLERRCRHNIAGLDWRGVWHQVAPGRLCPARAAGRTT
jgi:hypothetical protein